MNKDRFNKVFDKMASGKYSYGAIACTQDEQGNLWSRGTAGRTIDSPMAIASISKLFTTTSIMCMYEQGRLSLDDKISKWLPVPIVERLHVLAGKDYTQDLTICHLLTQTSGLPDYFAGGEKPLVRRLVHEDMYVSLEQLADWTRNMQPQFVPSSGRAYYSDMNFDLLGGIITEAGGESVAKHFKSQITEPLGLKHTYAVAFESDHVPTMYMKNTSVQVPKYLRSCPASGGIISTPRELLRFLRAFWNQELFETDLLSIGDTYKVNMGPIKYGAGYMRMDFGLLGLPVGKTKTLLGHSGSTGCYAYYSPEKKQYYIGDLNQMKYIGRSVRMLMQMAG